MNAGQRRIRHRAFARAWPLGRRVRTRHGWGTIVKHYDGDVGLVVRMSDGPSAGRSLFYIPAEVLE
jgi:hypothetical protein